MAASFISRVAMSAASSEQTASRATCVAHAWLSAEVYRMLEIEAGIRRLHPDQLAAKILDRVLCGDDVAVLLGS